MIARPPCSFPDCPLLAVSRGRCGLHPWRKSTRAYRKEVSKAMRRTHGMCARCGLRRAVVAHHIVERQHGGPDLASNLEPLCDVCHRDRHSVRPVRSNH